MTDPRVCTLDVSPELRALLAFLDECATLSSLLTELGATQEAADLDTALNDFLYSLEPPDGADSRPPVDVRA